MRKLFIAAFALMASVALANDNGNPKPHAEVEAGGNVCRITFYTPDIVRVTKHPVGTTAPQTKSEVITMTPTASLPITVSPSASTVRLKSSSLQVTIDRRTGLLSFASTTPEGKGHHIRASHRRQGQRKIHRHPNLPTRQGRAYLRSRHRAGRPTQPPQSQQACRADQP